MWTGDFAVFWDSAFRRGGLYAVDSDLDGDSNFCDADDDDDGTLDGLDCAPLDETAASEPLEVGGVLVTQAPATRVSWTEQEGARYDVISGKLIGLAVDGGATQATCVAAAHTSSPWDDPRPDPLPAAGYYYLLRARNVCGVGGYGLASSATPRVPAVDCPHGL